MDNKRLRFDGRNPKNHHGYGILQLTVLGLIDIILLPSFRVLYVEFTTFSSSTPPPSLYEVGTIVEVGSVGYLRLSDPPTKMSSQPSSNLGTVLGNKKTLPSPIAVSDW